MCIKLKKYLIILLLLFSFFTLSSCQKDQDKPTLLVPSGSPLIAIAGVISETDSQIVVGPAAIPAEFTKQEKDIIVAPIIVGTKLFNAGASKYQLAAVIGWGNLYIVSRHEINSLVDLENKNLAAFGEHATPGIIIKSIINEKNITFFDSVPDVVGPFKKGQYDFALISEPFLSTLIRTSDESLHVYDLKDDETLPKVSQVGIFINPDSDKLSQVNSFLKSVENNITNLNQNPTDYAKKIVDSVDNLDKLGEELISEAIPKLNLDYVKALDAKADYITFLEFLKEINPELIGGKLPEEGFYYNKWLLKSAIYLHI